MTIDIGDTVLHHPTGEKWIVAAVDGDDLYWCGYPFGGCARLTDCELLEKATKDQRERTIKDICKSRTPNRIVSIALEVARREGIECEKVGI